ncbi:MAG TPA: hypothetical protein PKV41_03325, partial [Candidatus Omnitrophota bacterium]|nr:hypothetical protein [Candidatus Omnitrophota bacterium]
DVTNDYKTFFNRIIHNKSDYAGARVLKDSGIQLHIQKTYHPVYAPADMEVVEVGENKITFRTTVENKGKSEEVLLTISHLTEIAKLEAGEEVTRKAFVAGDKIAKGDYIGFADFFRSQHSYINVSMTANGAPVDLIAEIAEHEKDLDAAINPYFAVVKPLADQFNALMTKEQTIQWQVELLTEAIDAANKKVADLEAAGKVENDGGRDRVAKQQAAEYGLWEKDAQYDAEHHSFTEEEMAEKLNQLGSGNKTEISVGISYPYPPGSALIPVKIADGLFGFIRVQGSDLAYAFDMINRLLSVQDISGLIAQGTVKAYAKLTLLGVALVDTGFDTYNFIVMKQKGFARDGGTHKTPQRVIDEPLRLLLDIKDHIPGNGKKAFVTIDFTLAKALWKMASIPSWLLGELTGKENNQFINPRSAFPSVYEYGYTDQSFTALAESNMEPDRYMYGVVRGLPGEKETLNGVEYDASQIVYSIRIDLKASNKEEGIQKYHAARQYPIYKDVNNDQDMKSRDAYLTPGQLYIIPSLKARETSEPIAVEGTVIRNGITGEIVGQTSELPGFNVQTQRIIGVSENGSKYLTQWGINNVDRTRPRGEIAENDTITHTIYDFAETSLEQALDNYNFAALYDGQIIDLIKRSVVDDDVSAEELVKSLNADNPPATVEAVTSVSEARKYAMNVKTVQEIFADVKSQEGQYVRSNVMVAIEIEGREIFYNPRDIDINMLTAVFKGFGNKVDGVQAVIVDVTGMFTGDAQIIDVDGRSVLILNPASIYTQYAYQTTLAENIARIEALILSDRKGLAELSTTPAPATAEDNVANNWNTERKTYEKILRDGMTDVLSWTQTVYVDETDKSVVMLPVERNTKHLFRLSFSGKSFYVDSFEGFSAYMTKELKAGQSVTIHYAAGEAPLVISAQEGQAAPTIVVGGPGVNFANNEIGIVEFGANVPDVKSILEGMVEDGFVAATVDPRTGKITPYRNDGTLPRLEQFTAFARDVQGQTWDLPASGADNGEFLREEVGIRSGIADNLITIKKELDDLTEELEEDKNLWGTLYKVVERLEAQEGDAASKQTASVTNSMARNFADQERLNIATTTVLKYVYEAAQAQNLTPEEYLAKQREDGDVFANLADEISRRFDGTIPLTGGDAIEFLNKEIKAIEEALSRYAEFERGEVRDWITKELVKMLFASDIYFSRTTTSGAKINVDDLINGNLALDIEGINNTIAEITSDTYVLVAKDFDNIDKRQIIDSYNLSKLQRHGESVPAYSDPNLTLVRIEGGRLGVAAYRKANYFSNSDYFAEKEVNEGMTYSWTDDGEADDFTDTKKMGRLQRLTDSLKMWEMIAANTEGKESYAQWHAFAEAMVAQTAAWLALEQDAAQFMR